MTIFLNYPGGISQPNSVSGVNLGKIKSLHMYTGLLHLHNLLRWIVIIASIFTLFRAYKGWIGNKGWGKSDNLAGLIFTLVIDLQFLTGILLYAFFSPIIKAAFANFGGAMKNADLRFFCCRTYCFNAYGNYPDPHWQDEIEKGKGPF